jgi:hypothetical protein
MVVLAAFVAIEARSRHALLLGTGRHPGPARGPRQLPGGRSKAAGKPHPATAGHIHVAGLATESADIGAPYPRERAP